MDIQEIQNLIKFVSSKQNISEVKIEKDAFSITIKTSRVQKKSEAQPTLVQAPVQQTAPIAELPQQVTPAPEAKNDEAENSKFIPIKSQMIGTFYSRPKPDKSDFVKVGDKVSKGSTLCIIEAMKLFNEIESDVSGTIAKILVENNSPVEFDQTLFLIDPE